MEDNKATPETQEQEPFTFDPAKLDMSEQVKAAQSEAKAREDAKPPWKWPADLVSGLSYSEADALFHRVSALARDFAMAASTADLAPNARECYAVALDWILGQDEVRAEFDALVDGEQETDEAPAS